MTQKGCQKSNKIQFYFENFLFSEQYKLYKQIVEYFNNLFI